MAKPGLGMLLAVDLVLGGFSSSSHPESQCLHGLLDEGQMGRALCKSNNYVFHKYSFTFENGSSKRLDLGTWVSELVPLPVVHDL